MTTDDRRLAAIGAAAATVLREMRYHAVRAEDVAAAVRMPAQGGGSGRGGHRRSAVWLYNEVKSRRVLVGLAAYSAWLQYLDRSGWTQPPPPRTMTEVRRSAVSALAEVIRFHHAERSLMTQVAHGIGDIATTEKRGGDVSKVALSWPDSAWGRVAADAFQARCGVFAGFLAPVLANAMSAVTLADPTANTHASRLLSDVAFRACLARPDAPAGDLAEGLAGFWLDGELTSSAGAWVRDLESAERMLAATQRRGTDPRAEAAAHAALIRVLLEAGTVYARATAEGAELVARLTALTGWDRAKGGAATVAARADLESLSDAASGQGLVALRFGDLRPARQAWLLSREVAEEGLGHEESRIARADNNLALLASMAGHPRDALGQIAEVVKARSRLCEHSQDRESGWRRLAITQDTWATIAYRAGHVVEAVRLASAMLDDRITTIGSAENVNVAEARMTFARALLAAGHPLEARRHAEEASRFRRERFIHSGFRVQDDVVVNARIALTMGAPADAIELLTAAPVRKDWFAEHVSFRLAHQALLLHAAALSEAGDPDTALVLLENTPLPAPGGNAIDPGDPLVADRHLAFAACLLRAGDVSAAAERASDALAALRAADDPPRKARGLLLAARCADAGGKTGHARDLLQQILALGADAGLDRTHPALLAAHYDQASRSLREGNSAAVLRLVGPIVDRSVLGHGRPALGEGHPLLARARELARQAGTPPAPVEDVPWEAL